MINCLRKFFAFTSLSANNPLRIATAALVAVGCSSSTTTQNILQSSGGATTSGGFSGQGNSSATGGTKAPGGSQTTGGISATGGAPTVTTGGNAATGSTSATTGGNVTTGGASATGPTFSCALSCVESDGKCWGTCENNAVSPTGTLNPATSCEASCTTQTSSCINNCGTTTSSCILDCGTDNGNCWSKCFTSNYGTFDGASNTTLCQQSCNEANCVGSCVSG